MIDHDKLERYFAQVVAWCHDHGLELWRMRDAIDYLEDRGVSDQTPDTGGQRVGPQSPG